MTKTKKLVTCALLVAVSTALALLSDILPIRLPFGGSITLVSMLPIVIAAYMFGLKWGIGSAFVYSVVQLLISFKTVSAYFLPGEDQMVLWKALLICLIDYIIAYTVIGFAGVFRKTVKNTSASLCLGSVVGLFLRYLAHIISGAIFFGSWAGWFFEDKFPEYGEATGRFSEWALAHFSGDGLGWFYSVVYNGLYMIPEIVLTAVVAFILPLFLKKYIKVYD